MSYNNSSPKILHRGKTREEYEQEGVVQSGIAFPSASEQEHLLIIRLDITRAIFKNESEAKTKVKEGLKRLCTLFENIYEGKKRIDELSTTEKNSLPDDEARLKSQDLRKAFKFSSTIGFGYGFFEKLGIPENRRPKKLHEMPDHEQLGDITPYSLAQTDLIIQLCSTKDFVNRWVLENTLQPDEDEVIEKLLKKQKERRLNNETERRILKKLLEDTTPKGFTPPLKEGQRVCIDGQVLSSGEEECIPDIVSAINGWATITDIHAGFQRIDGRNLMGFNDGVSNPRPGKDDKGKLFDEKVFTTRDDENNKDLDYGTYMVFQKIQHDLDQWRELSLDEQQEWVGRSKGTGLLLGTLSEDDDASLARDLRSNDEKVRKDAALDIEKLLAIQTDPTKRFYDERGRIIDMRGRRRTYKINPAEIRKGVQAWSHVRKANPRREDGEPEIVIFRRGYPFLETGLNNKILSGLLFVCFQKDIQNGFEFIKRNWLNNKNFPVPQKRGFTDDEKRQRHKVGRLSADELLGLSSQQRKDHGLDKLEDFNQALQDAGIVEPAINNRFNSRDIDKNDFSLVPDTQNTGREGLAGPSEHGTVPTGEFLAIVPFGGGYYFVPPIAKRKISNIGQQFFE
jgi:Dyp-type peroxidase family